MPDSKRVKLHITEVKEPRPVGQAEVLDFMATLENEQHAKKYGVWSKSLYEHIKKDVTLDCDFSEKVSDKVDDNGNPYVSRKVTQIYIDGKPVVSQKPSGFSHQDSPEKLISIEKQNAFSGLVQIVCAGISAGLLKLTDPFPTDVIHYGCQKLGIKIGGVYETPTKEIKQALEKPQSQIEPSTAEVTTPKRDVTLIKTGNDLFKACKADFGIVPQVVLKELEIESTAEIKPDGKIKSMAEAYNIIAQNFKN